MTTSTGTNDHEDAGPLENSCEDNASAGTNNLIHVSARQIYHKINAFFSREYRSLQAVQNEELLEQLNASPL